MVALRRRPIGGCWPARATEGSPIVGAQVIAYPGRTAFNVDDLDSATVEDLLRLDSLQEVTKGATISFRHDVLRDWTIGFMLHQNKGLLASLAMDQPISAGLSRGLEITARCALDADADGKAWLSLLNLTEREGRHGSWKRPILLALTRSEHALLHMNGLKLALLENSGHRLGELLRLMIAVEFHAACQGAEPNSAVYRNPCRCR